MCYGGVCSGEMCNSEVRWVFSAFIDGLVTLGVRSDWLTAPFQLLFTPELG